MRYEVVNLSQASQATRNYQARSARVFGHSFYGWLGLRPFLAQHTAPEHEAICRWAAGRSRLVEIGVAEGVSASAIRKVMAENGRLYLIDPFHLSRVPALNFMRRAARRAVASCPRGEVVWIEKFSSDAVRDWNTPIDFLFIDGDHSEKGVRQDWEEWSRYVVPGGIVMFHDARLFESGWTTDDYGPVKLVDDLFRRRPIPEWRIVEEVHSLVVVERVGGLPPESKANGRNRD